MKHSMIKKIGYLLTAVLFLFCCTSEKESFWRDVEKEEIQSFFKFESSHSRTKSFTTDLIQVVINTLCNQRDLLDAVLKYKKEYGVPLWNHSVGISVENGYQLFVPVHKKESQDEIQAIWHFGVYDNRLYHFTLNRPQSTIVEEYWKFDYFTIFALGKKPSSGLYFKDVTLSRSASENCQSAYVGVEMNEEYEEIIVDVMCWDVDDSQFLNDGESGGGGGGLGNGGFPSDVPIDNGSNPGLPPGGTGGGSSVPSLAPKAQAIFRNSNMIDANWRVLENMIEKIIENCMGRNLYNGLLEKMNGGTFIIQFKENANGAFGPIGEGIGITLGMQMESNQLFHEMMHAYRSFQETTNSYNSSTLNGEFEAWYAQYLYTSSLPEYKNSKWEKRDYSDERRKAIKKLNSFIDKKGNLQPEKSSMDLEIEILEKVIPAFRETYTEEKYPYDYTREAIDNFKNIKKLTEGC